MKYRFILFLTGIFLILTVVFFGFSSSENERLFSFELRSSDKAESISYWIDEDNKFYVFMPGYAELSDVSLNLNTETHVSINNLKLTEGMSCNNFSLNTPYDLIYHKWGKTHQTSITFVRSGEVPAMFIDTQSGNMDYIHLKKDNAESGAVRLFFSDGSINYSGDIESVSGRGNSTWDSFDKKPYSIRLRESADLLSMGEAQEWVLLANADDASNIRNKLVYDFADKSGLQYSPDSQWVDLYLNGEYAGLYLLSERNEIHPQRVDISATDSFLVSLEAEDRLVSQGINYVSTDSGMALRVHNPKSVSEETLSYIKTIWQTFENALLSPDGIDPDTGRHWSEFIDLDSWAKKYLIEEVFGNFDACALSQYFYYEEASGKIFAGPVWDFDHAMGTKTIWQITDPQIMLANRSQVSSSYSNPWFATLYQNEEFFNLITEMYRTEFKPLLGTLLNTELDSYCLQISEASAMNKLRWDGLTASAEEETKEIIDYMSARLEFLDSLWINEDEYIMVRADSSFGVHYAYYAVAPGDTLDSLPVFEDTDNLSFRGWFYADSGEEFDPSGPVIRYTEVYAKWENTDSVFDDIEKLLPLAVISLMFACLLFVDIKRNRKGEDK